MNITSKILFLISIFIIFLFATLNANDDLSVTIRRLSDRAIIVNVNGLAVHNVVAIETEKGIVVVDTEVGPVFAQKIREKIEQEFGSNNFRHVINTHAQGDPIFCPGEKILMTGDLFVPDMNPPYWNTNNLDQLPTGLKG